MDINRKNMDALFVGFNTSFSEGFAKAPDTWTKFAAPVQSGTASTIYPFLEHFGGMKEWVGDRKIGNVASRKIEVVNRDFEDTVAIARNDVEDDQIGIYASLIAQMGYNAGKLWQDLAVEALLSSSNWVDGSAFFSTSRTYGSNTICNKTSSALSASSYAAARAAMMQYKGHNDRIIGVNPNLLIVGPANEATAFSILKDQLMLNALTSGGVSGVGATGNPWQGTAELLVLPELSGTNANVWFLADSASVLKPVIVQQRKAPELTALDNASDENVFARKEYVYGTDARGEAFLAFPHLIYKGTPA